MYLRYWERSDGTLLENGEKYRIDNTAKREGYKTTMQLNVTNIGPHDFTQYYCISKNELQKTKGVFTIFGMKCYIVLFIYQKRCLLSAQK